MAGRIIYLIFILPMMAFGAFIVLRSLEVFGPIPTSPDGPAWLGVLFGIVFLAGSSSALIKIFFGGDNLNESGIPQSAPFIVRIFYNGLALTIVVGLGALFTWVAFGPGERQFSGSGAFLGAGVGRAAFGLAAIAVWLVLAWCGVRWIRRRRA
jgi:hypothetical protein